MAGEKYTNIGKARWENANVGVIKWDPENKAGLASVIDETTGTVYEIGGSGGGGGESDFSTAQVTIVNPPMFLNLPVLVDNPEYVTGIMGQYHPLEGENTITIALYKGHCYYKSSNIQTVSGNIQLDETLQLYDITGDCTITFIGGV